MSSCTGEMQLLCRTRRGWNKQSGDYVEFEYRGLRDAIYGLLAEAKNQGAENYDIDHDGPTYTLKVRFSNPNDGSTESAVDEVRLNANRATLSIYNHPNFASVPLADVKLIRAAIQNADSNFNTGQLDPGSPLSIDLYELLLAGVDHYIVHQPVLVRTRIASSAFQFGQPDPYSNIGAIISPATILADAALSDLLRVILPTGVNDGQNADFGVGWLKHYPEYTQAAGNKAVLTQEYEYGRWSRVIYGDPL